MMQSMTTTQADQVLDALTARTGHEYELRGDEGGFYVFDWTVGDSAGEGATREEAIEAALEAV